MKQELIKIIDELRQVISQQKMNVSDDVLFTQASSFLRGELASQSRNPFNQKNTQESKQINYPKKNYSKKPTKPITDKQAAFLAELGYEGTYNLTTFQASKEIEKLRGENERKNKVS